MAGRRERQKEGRERRILRAADTLFASRGYRETGMVDVARRARIAVGTVYNYFPSKRELLAALVGRETGETLGDGERVVKEPPADPARALGELFDVYLQLVGRHDRALWRELIGSAIASPDAVTRVTLEADARLVEQLTRLLSELRARGALREDVDPGQAALTLYAVYITWFMAFIAADDVSAEQLRTQLARGSDVVLHGLLPARPEARRTT